MGGDGTVRGGRQGMRKERPNEDHETNYHETHTVKHTHKWDTVC
jgi:hypothetical protein